VPDNEPLRGMKRLGIDLETINDSQSRRARCSGTVEDCRDSESGDQGLSSAVVTQGADDGMEDDHGEKSAVVNDVRRAIDADQGAAAASRRNDSSFRDKAFWFWEKKAMKADAVKSGNAVFAGRDGKAGKAGKRFASYPSHDVLLDAIIESQQPCFYEMIRTGEMCKLYFDIEWMTDKQAPDDATAATECTKCAVSIEGVKRVITDVLQELLPDVLGQDRETALEVIQLNGCRRHGDKIKNSYHLIYPALVFRRNNGLMKHIAKCVFGKVGERFSFEKNPVDVGVYDSDRLFRAPLCYKLDDATQTRLSFGTDADDVRNSAELEHNTWLELRKKCLRAFVTYIPSGASNIDESNHEHGYRDFVASARGGRGERVRNGAGRQGHRRVFAAATDITRRIMEANLQATITRLGGVGQVLFSKDDVKDELQHGESETDTGANFEEGFFFRLQHGEPGRAETCFAHGPHGAVTHHNENQYILMEADGKAEIRCFHKTKCRGAHFKLGKFEIGKSTAISQVRFSPRQSLSPHLPSVPCVLCVCVSPSVPVSSPPLCSVCVVRVCLSVSPCLLTSPLFRVCCACVSLRQSLSPHLPSVPCVLCVDGVEEGTGCWMEGVECSRQHARRGGSLWVKGDGKISEHG